MTAVGQPGVGAEPSPAGGPAPLQPLVGGASREEPHTRLAKLGIQLNAGARTLLEDSCFDTRAPETLEVVRPRPPPARPRLRRHPPADHRCGTGAGSRPAPPPDTGPYLRLAITDQGQAPDSILSAGRAPTGAVHVHSVPLRADHDYPKGFYLRVVDGVTWSRGFRCDEEYVWPADAVLALRAPDA
ncbi:hypothetical protein [Brachybacterium sp. GPGPB12]|uniref:hypothetical protein n=1 Tax=Brachybacterium sp. GPGPB12 TaxID=3023517 RepID=UPI003134605B